MTLQEKLGQLFIVGFEGSEPSEALKDLIQRHRIGGVILLGRNIRDPLQLLSLTTALQESRGALPGLPSSGGLKPAPTNLPLFIAVDQEGGRVSRLKAPFTQFPSPTRLGKSGSVEMASAVGASIGKELRAVGINVNFAPVLDVNINPQNPVIGDRAFGSDPALVGKLGVAFFQGLKDQRIISVGKHFPGHGDTALDSHEALPVVGPRRERLERVELRPFAEAIKAGIPALMTAHVLYPALDPLLPATLSKTILTDLLRGELAFPGLIMSDDLEMKAIASYYGIGEAAVRFVEAGGDLVLICHRFDRQLEAVEAVRRAVEEGRLSEERIDTSLERIAKAKEEYLTPYEPLRPEGLSVIGCEEHRKLALREGGIRSSEPITLTPSRLKGAGCSPST